MAGLSVKGGIDIVHPKLPGINPFPFHLKEEKSVPVDHSNERSLAPGTTTILFRSEAGISISLEEGKADHLFILSVYSALG